MYVEFLPGKKHSGKDAEISDDLDSFADAGYLLTDNDLIVDIDTLNHEQIEKMLEMFNVNTEVVWTGRGAHLYFKKPEGFRGATGVCALGVKVEYKHIANTKAITVKLDGIARKVERKGIREQFPDFLKKGKYDVLQGLNEGEGRNEQLFKHRKLMKNLQDWKICIDYINQYIFDTPLPKKEIETIQREMQLEAVAGGENAIADLIMHEKRVAMYNNHLYFYNGYEYICDNNELDRMVYRYCEGQKTNYVREVIAQMEKRCKLVPSDETFHIKFKNGVLRNGEFFEVDYTDFTPYSLDIEYIEDAEPVKEVDDYINQLTDNDATYRLRLMEILGHCLITDKEFKRLMGKFFIFVGDGGNGKGTLLTIIRRILNNKNCSGLSIKNMTDERYFNVLSGRLANLGDDIQDEPINNEQMKMLKNISTCDYVEIRKLFENSRSVEMTTTLIFTSNHVLKSFEKGTSYKRRVDWLPMYTKPKKKDPKFITKLTTPNALKYWIRLIVEGYKRLYQNQSFTKCDIVENYNQQYHKENNTAIEYILDLSKEDFIGKRAPEVYEQYKIWCEENGENIQSSKLFKLTLEEIHELKIKARKINGKTQKVYISTD
ncbi:hypothetical protein KG091_07840 [Carnobacteriaceae bacterium zg-ZUI78]|nr:hypothetical protein [Carnobacteriaceae bacterium zg-ZUI78]